MVTRLSPLAAITHSVATPHTHLPHGIPPLSTDAIIVGITALIFAYGVIAGYAALVRESISVYVGLVLANTFGAPAYHLIAPKSDGHFPVGQTEVQLLLLIAPIVILQFTRHHHGKTAHNHNLVVTLILSALAAMLVVSSVLSQLAPASLHNTLESSNLASWIYQLRLAWLALVPVMIAVGAVFAARHKHHR